MKCSNCGSDVNDKTNFCSSCGVALNEYQDNKPISLKNFKIFFVLIIFISSISLYFLKKDNWNFSAQSLLQDINSSISLEKHMPAESEIIYISGSRLLAEYKSHELKADEKFKNKFVEISGKILSIDKVMGDVTVTFATKQVDYDFIIDTVSCSISDEKEIKTLLNYNKGDFLYALGIVDGYNNISQSVEIESCHFYKKSKKIKG